MKHLCHWVMELCEEASRLCNIRDAEKEMDQNPSKTLQLHEAPLH